MVLFLQPIKSFCYIPENESKQDVLGWNTSRANIPKHDGTNIPRHTSPQGTIIHRREECLNNIFLPLGIIRGGKTAHIPKLLTANIPNILVPPGPSKTKGKKYQPPKPPPSTPAHPYHQKRINIHSYQYPNSPLSTTKTTPSAPKMSY